MWLKKRRKKYFLRISRNKFFIATILFLTLASVFFIIKSQFFIIKSVDVYLEKIGCSDTVQVREVANLLGHHILSINPVNIEDIIKSNFLCIKNVHISRVFPDRLQLFASGREAKAMLLLLKSSEASMSANIEDIATPSARTKEISSRFLIDDEGIVFSKEIGEYKGVEIYYNNNNLTMGRVEENSILNTLKILEKIKILGFEIKEAEILENFFLVYPQVMDENINPQMIVFKLDGNLDTQLASLQLILNKAKIDNESFRFIDLRFDKPVIKLAPKKN